MNTFGGFIKMGNVDPRILKQVAGNPKMLRSQGSDFLSRLPPPSTSSRLKGDEGAVFDAVVRGYGSLEEISQVTGLQESQVKSYIKDLEAKGMLSTTKEEQVTIVEPSAQSSFSTSTKDLVPKVSSKFTGSSLSSPVMKPHHSMVMYPKEEDKRWKY